MSKEHKEDDLQHSHCHCYGIGGIHPVFEELHDVVSILLTTYKFLHMTQHYCGVQNTSKKRYDNMANFTNIAAEGAATVVDPWISWHPGNVVNIQGLD